MRRRQSTDHRDGQTSAAAPGPVVPATAAAVRQRSVWADAAKGVCILLVVLWHVVMKHYLQIDWRVSLPIPGLWGGLTQQLLPLRMPLFFTISGMFAVGAVTRPWRVVGRSKVAKFFYLYALWLFIHTALLSLVPDFDTLKASSALDVLEQLTITPTNLWYLYALALYFVIAKVLRRAPMALVLGAALVLSATAATGVLDIPGNRGGLYQNLVWFLGGLYFRPYIERLAANASWARVALTTAAYGAIMVVITLTASKAVPGVWPLACVVATVFGVTAAARISEWTWLAEGLARLGRTTLPIYIIHMPLLALLHRALVTPLSADLDGRLRLLLAVVEPIVMSAFLVWLCLLLHRGLLRAGATWLFDLPGGGGRSARHARRAPEADMAPATPAPPSGDLAAPHPGPPAPPDHAAPAPHDHAAPAAPPHTAPQTPTRAAPQGQPTPPGSAPAAPPFPGLGKPVASTPVDGRPPSPGRPRPTPAESPTLEFPSVPGNDRPTPSR
ncbi:acyltransferase [Sphaerisporangium sp. TRM90804]|uniref:acyltransferase n=1 Tax=Sphaerisporangium sp. TRM90804 TaxID=3031113 RepID=UPI002446ED6A|nr:acyltransferase [Sphaerisporangium sp. TRM90804]MDH2426874.1 acyltransferase [Sphaerisporangium sp. TRM90804]